MVPTESRTKRCQGTVAARRKDAGYRLADASMVRGHSGGETEIGGEVRLLQHLLCRLAQRAHWRLRVLRGEIAPILEHRLYIGVARNDPRTHLLRLENRRFRPPPLV